MGKIILIGATKGGVGKSVSTYNLAYSLKEMGKKVLAVDFDSQANLTACFGEEPDGVDGISIGELMMLQIDDKEMPPKEQYIRTRNGVDYIPASMSLSAVDARLRLELGAERMLANILEPLRDAYDYIVIDTCPSIGALTINALAAADGVIITVNPQYLAMVGLQEFLKTIKKIKGRINQRLAVEGILFTMVDERTNLYKAISDQVSEAFDGKIRIFDSRIPNTVKVGESIYYSEPLLEYAPTTKACKAYMEFGREIIENEK